MNNLKLLEKILWKTKEGRDCKAAIKWCNDRFPKMTQKKIDEKLKIFEKKIDEPLNKRWEQLKKLYNIRKIK